MEKHIAKTWKLILFIFPCLFVLSACSSDDYLNVIPQNSIALVSVDGNDLYSNSATNEQKSYIKDLLKVNDLTDCGIDLSCKVYLFETEDGNIGCVFKVKDEDDLNEWFNDLSKVGYCKKITSRRGFCFTSIKDTWIAGFSSTALLIMGPVLPVQQVDVQRQMVKYLEQDEEQGIKVTPIFEKLDSLSSPISIVAQAAALPEKLVGPLTIGAPKGADASQIMIAAEISKGGNGYLSIKGQTFSFNKTIDSSLQANKKIFRKIKGTYTESMSQNYAVGMFINVNGKEFIDVLHSNNSFQALLAGMNSAIDMDNIIRCIDGDMSIVIPSLSGVNYLPQMSAELANKDFLKDVDYWKKSCPSGCKIIDWKKNSYYFTDGKLYFYFGVSNDMQFYSGSTPENAYESILRSRTALSDNIQKDIIGKHMCFILNLNAVFENNEDKNAAFNLLKPLFGNIKTILYSM